MLNTRRVEGDDLHDDVFCGVGVAGADGLQEIIVQSHRGGGVLFFLEEGFEVLPEVADDDAVEVGQNRVVGGFGHEGVEGHIVFDAVAVLLPAFGEGGFEAGEVFVRAVGGSEAGDLLFQGEARFKDFGEFGFVQPVVHGDGETVVRDDVGAVSGAGGEDAGMDEGLDGFADGVVADGEGLGQFRLGGDAVADLPFAEADHVFHRVEYLAGEGAADGFFEFHGGKAK